MSEQGNKFDTQDINGRRSMLQVAGLKDNEIEEFANTKFASLPEYIREKLDSSQKTIAQANANPPAEVKATAPEPATSSETTEETTSKKKSSKK